MICGVCGKGNRQPFVPPPAETAPDLDLRPGEPTRSTLRRWIINCVSCGATAPDLTKLTPAALAVIETPDYRNQLNPFLRWAMLLPADPQAWLMGAWYADDRGDVAEASSARSRAADAWGKPADTGSALQLLDILRRAGRFDDATRLADGLTGLDEGSAGIVAFQRSCLAAADTGRHLISSALRPPARTPHVAHSVRPKVGFWGRLLGNK